MVNRFTIVRPGEPLPKGLQSGDKKIIDLSDPVIKTEDTSNTPQPSASAERFQTEMYKAMEILGRKLERAESENIRLAGRLAQIESATAIDEKTGRLYLPALVETGGNAQDTAIVRKTAKSTFAASAFSIMVAFFALGLAVFNQPQAPITMGVMLSKEQLEALDVITAQHMAGLNTSLQGAATAPQATGEQIQSGQWQSIENFNDPEQAPAVAEAQSEINPDIAPGLLPETDPALNPQAVITKQADETGMKVTAAPVAPVSVVETASAVAEQEQVAEEQAVQASANYTTVEKDKSLTPALQKIEKRAFDGVAEAQHDLATIYASGKSVSQDYKRAVYWFSRAADGGIANAHYNLGVMFQQGLGLRKDAGKAIGWYRSAAELGHPEAMYNLGIAYIDGVGVTQNIERGAGYFKRAAGAGVAQAAYNLGVLYESGFLGAIDLDQALHWYTQAKNKKHAEAGDAIARIKKQKQAAAKQPPSLPADAASADIETPDLTAE